VIEAGRITAVGRRGEVRAPAGAARVDLTGKTVIPALVDAHSHIGYMRNLTSGRRTTRERTSRSHAEVRLFGVAASMALGSDFGELPYELRDEINAGKHPTAARFVTPVAGLLRAGNSRDAPLRHRITNEGRSARGGARACGAQGHDREDLGRQPRRHHPEA